MNIERVNKSLTEIEMQDIRNTVEYVHLKIQKMYPIGYFSHSKGKLYLKEAMKHYAYNIKGLTEDELIQQFSQSLIKEAGLINGIRKAYNHNITLFFLDMFPHKKIWDMVVIPVGVWTDEVAHDFVIWYLEEELGLSLDTVLSKVDVRRIAEDRAKTGTTLARNINKFGSVAKLILSAYPSLDKETVTKTVNSLQKKSK